MAELMKNQYDYKSIYNLASNIKSIYKPFLVETFVEDIIDETWEDLALKARMRKITINLGKYLPQDYSQALKIIDQVTTNLPHNFSTFIFMCFSDFVEVFGQKEEHWDLSIAALARYTMFFTSEFAVRPFIINHENRMMEQMLQWSKHENEHIRRLASEGCRPQLPWGQALPSFKKDPTKVIKILEQLKTDSSLYVRKSVANNLNDISKTHPDLVISLVKDWHGKNKATDWILKHGCRTLLKKGNRTILNIFGFENNENINVSNFALATKKIYVGDHLIFSFTIKTKQATKIRLEYGIDYVKANGKRDRKIFQISQINLSENQQKNYIKKHALTNVSSRKHYTGLHSVTLFVNGIEQGTHDFELLS